DQRPVVEDERRAPRAVPAAPAIRRPAVEAPRVELQLPALPVVGRAVVHGVHQVLAAAVADHLVAVDLPHAHRCPLSHWRCRIGSGVLSPSSALERRSASSSSSTFATVRAFTHPTTSPPPGPIQPTSVSSSGSTFRASRTWLAH